MNIEIDIKSFVLGIVVGYGVILWRASVAVARDKTKTGECKEKA